MRPRPGVRYANAMATGRDSSRMTVTEADLRLMRRVRSVARFAIFPLALVMVGLKLAGWIELSWLLVLLPAALYVLHPIVVGVLGPQLQYRRHRDRVESDGTRH
jgi:hypothetical protein